MHLGDFLNDLPIRKVFLQNDSKAGIVYDKGEPATVLNGNVIASLNPDGTHFPVIDIDFPCHLFESSNGFGHLIIKKKLSQKQYKKLLETLTEVGLYNQGCMDAFNDRGFSAVRLPWIKKESVIIQEL